MEMLVSSAATAPSRGAAGSARFDNPTHSVAGQAHAVSHDAAVAAMALGAKAKLVVIGERPLARWANEHDVVVAAVAVILTALFTIIAVAAAAIFSMG